MGAFKPLERKYFSFAFSEIVIMCRIPPHRRGAYASSRYVEAGCDGREGCAGRAQAGTDGEVVWSWRPGADAQRNARNAHCRDTGARKPVPEESAYKP